VRGKGVHAHRICADRPRTTNRKFPLILTTGPHPQPVQRRRADPAHANSLWHSEDVLEIHPTMPNSAASMRATGLASPAAPATPCCAHASAERMQPGVVYTTFHFPFSGANVITTENSDWATNCPEYKVTAVASC
jgi:formate dehydrogenase major subunit